MEFKAYTVEVLDDRIHGLTLDRHFQTETFPIEKSVLAQLTDRDESQIKRLYMHHSDEADGAKGPFANMAERIKADIAYLKNMQTAQAGTIGALCLAYNFVITKDGIIWCVRPADKVPASQIGDNTNGLSVCFDGNFMEQRLSSVQLTVGKLFFRFLVQKYHIKSVSDIRGHRDVASMHPDNPGFYATACPGTEAYAHDLPIIQKYAITGHN